MRVLLISVALVFSACSEKAPECDSCPPGMICVAGHCQRLCQRDTECDSGQCEQGLCVARPVGDPALDGDSMQDGDPTPGDVRLGGDLSGNSTTTCAGILGGTYEQTQEAAGSIVLDGAQTTGTWTSSVCDAGIEARWQTLSVVPLAPYGKRLSRVDDLEYATDTISTEGIIGLWHFDGAIGPLPVGKTISDQSGLQHHGVTNNADDMGMVREAGLFNEALRCDGLDDYVQIDSTQEMRGLDALTVQAWFNPGYQGSAGVHMRLLALYETGDLLGSSFMLGHFSDGSAGITAVQGGLGYAAKEPFSAVRSRWTHLAAVFDGSQLTTYIDGVQSAQVTALSGVLDDRTGPLYFCQGGSQFLPPRHVFDGAIDEVAIWRRAMTSDEIGALHRRGLLNLRYQVRSCDTADCTDEPFVGPDATAATYFSEADNTGRKPPVFNVLVPDSRYFQWRAYFDTEASGTSPALSDGIVQGLLLH